MTELQKVKLLRVVAIGPLPPPPGGVASSLKSLLDATQGREDITVRVIRWTEAWRLPLLRPDILHLHFSQPIKRLLGTLFARLLGARVAHTIHSNNFAFDSIGNRLALALSQGVIVLNADIQQRFTAQGIGNTVMMTPILASPTQDTATPLDPDLAQWMASRPGRFAAVYTHDRRMIDGYDLYGFGFVAGVLPQLHAMNWNVIFLDPFGVYTPGEVFPIDCPNAVLHSRHVGFSSLLATLDAYLRPTSTDGNSVAVLEALAEGVPVIASDIVPRPHGVRLFRFKDAADFLSRLKQPEAQDAGHPPPVLTTADEYVDFMSSLTIRATPQTKPEQP